MQLLNDLVELAKKATPGEWKAEWYDDERGYVTWYINLERQRAAFFLAGDGPELNGTGKPTDFDKADCNFIAAANPAAILAIAEYVKGIEARAEAFNNEAISLTGKVKSLENHIADAGKMMGWVKCNDRMPEDATMVLLRCDNDYDFGMLIGGEMKVFSMGEWKILPGAAITHWMPLPEAPHD